MPIRAKRQTAPESPAVKLLREELTASREENGQLHEKLNEIREERDELQRQVDSDADNRCKIRELDQELTRTRRDLQEVRDRVENAEGKVEGVELVFDAVKDIAESFGNKGATLLRAISEGVRG